LAMKGGMSTSRTKVWQLTSLADKLAPLSPREDC
jgi:hypothetical protein